MHRLRTERTVDENPSQTTQTSREVGQGRAISRSHGNTYTKARGL